MKMLSMQQVFDTVAAHLIAQFDKAFDKGIPKYRMATGLKCAVGVLITNDAYTSEIEDVAVAALNLDPTKPRERALYNALLSSGVDVDDLDTLNLVKGLQGIHDGWSPPYWPQKLREIAAQFELDPSVVDDSLRKRERAFALFERER